MPAGRSVIVDPPDGKIPYTPAAAQQQKENYKNRAKADPLNICYIPGVPRVMYLPFPIQIVQTPKFVLMASEFAHSLRRVFMDGSKHPDIALRSCFRSSRFYLSRLNPTRRRAPRTAIRICKASGK